MPTSTLQDTGFPRLQDKLRQRHRQLRDEIVQGLKESQQEDHQQLAGKVHERDADSIADLLVYVRLADIERDVRELLDVEDALARMHAGSYGVCTDCGEAIPSARLEAYPTAKRCRPCQFRHEQEKGRAGAPTL